MSEYTNNLNVVSTYKGEKSVSITGTFQCGIHFPKSGAKPFKVIERTSKNNKQYKQIACTVVISPDDRKNNNGNPFSSVYYDGKYLTFKEFLETTGVELIKGKDAHQLQTMAQNMAKERGIDLGDLMRSLGIGK